MSSPRRTCIGFRKRGSTGWSTRERRSKSSSMMTGCCSFKYPTRARPRGRAREGAESDRFVSKPPPFARRKRGRRERILHIVVRRGGRSGRLLLFGLLSDDGLGRQQQTSDGGGVLQGGTHHLGRIDDPFLHEIAEL